MQYFKVMKVKEFPISAGKLICVLNKIDAEDLGVFPGDRLELINKKNGKNSVAIVDVTNSEVKEKIIGLFEDLISLLKVKSNDFLEVRATPPLKSLDFIKKKMDGEKLNGFELKEIVKDIADNRLNDIEASAFISAVYMKGFDLEETTEITKALINNGQKISFNKEPIVDKHSIGGINGRTTMIIVPIVACAGLFIPKTSSRSITSAGGTADAMEVLAPVDLCFEKIKKITEKHGGVIVHGGAVDLAPADDKIIRIRHPLALDPEGMLIASVIAKKASVSSKYVVIDLPVGPYAKIKDKNNAIKMAKKFVQVGKEVGMEIDAVITNGEEPSGLAFGPALEAKYVMEILEGKRFDNLAQKSCELAGAIFELANLTGLGKGYDMAVDILHSGKALEKMKDIIHAQGGKIDSSIKIILSPLNKEIKAKENGVIQSFNLKDLTTIARISGAPANKLSGVMLNKVEGEKVFKGDVIMTIFAENKQKLESALDYTIKNTPYHFKRIILSSVRDSD
ncbi:MAG: thymidine phosphorylase [Candidatus ainarchaeum sp.]|nr:thymidine phosphorylase [Candidatus ainarchaeum sp.]